VTFYHSLNETARIVSINDTSEQDKHVISGFLLNGTGVVFFRHFPFQFSPIETEKELMDYFMDIIIHSNSSVPPEAYLDPTTLLREVRRSYSTYWAIFATLYQRIPLNAAQGGNSVEAVVYSQKQRVMQERIPTRVLEGLLGFVLLCVLIATAFIGRDKVLPKTPYSIGSRMSLLVGSFFSQLPEMRNDMTEEKLERALEPHLFTLGWSEGVDGATRFGVEIFKDVREGTP
jgi:hypothetical protein